MGYRFSDLCYTAEKIGQCNTSSCAVQNVLASVKETSISSTLLYIIVYQHY